MLGPIHCDPLSRASLLPKLRDQFAEFLNNPSPVGLRILSSSTCVGLRYGHLSIHQNFSRLVILRLPYLISVPYARVNQRPGSGTGTSLRLFSPQSIIDFPTISSVPFARRNQRPGSTISMCQLSSVRWLRNFYRMCIDYASRPRLSSRLTLGGRTFPRKP